MTTLEQQMDALASQLQGLFAGALGGTTDLAGHFGLTLAQATIGVFLVFVATTFREAFKPMFTEIAIILKLMGRESEKQTKVMRDTTAQQEKQTEAITTQSETLKLAQEKDELTRVVYALSKIKGGKDDSALRWANAKREETHELIEELAKRAKERDAAVAAGDELAEQVATLRVNEANEKAPFTDWAEFMEAFKAHFMLNEQSDMAQDALDVLIMGNKSCEEYTTMFNGYAETSGYDQVYLLRRYKAGLNAQLRTSVIRSFPTPVNLKEWKERALILDREWRREKGKPIITSEAKTPKKETKERDPNAMEIDAISVTERQDLMKKGACFTCKEHGHISRNCPQKKKGEGSKKPFVPFQKRNINAVKTDTLTAEDLGRMVGQLSQEEYAKFEAKATMEGFA